jgi:uridine phosphorylase
MNRWQKRLVRGRADCQISGALFASASHILTRAAIREPPSDRVRDKADAARRRIEFRLIDSLKELHQTRPKARSSLFTAFARSNRVAGMGDSSGPPILDHPVGEPSACTAEALIDDVRRLREVGNDALPAVCFLEFDGDLTDWLVEQRIAAPFRSWACFHTAMFSLELDRVKCGIIGRTIGGPYAVLIAEQLHAAGSSLIIGLTSAGRVAPDLSLPALVVATGAIRDEGTSYHYLPPGEDATCPSHLTRPIARELSHSGFAVRTGKVWTTDAPYRETNSQLGKWGREGALAVEMQAASLFAFGKARNADVAVVARVSNAVDHEGTQFDTGSNEQGLEILRALARAGQSVLDARLPA